MSEAQAAPADDAGILAADAPDASTDRQLTEVEQLAAEMGWNPNFKGTEDKPARPAADWIRFAGKNNSNLRREMAEIKGSVERIVKTADRQIKREVEQRAAEIQARFDAAIEEKDKAGAARAANEMTALQNEAREPLGTDPVAAFRAENPWFDPSGDDDASAYAIAVSNREAKKGNTDQAGQFKAIREAVKKRFPEVFGEEPAPAPKPPAALGDPGSRALGKPRAKGYSDMPDLAKGAADRTYEAAKMRGTAPADRKKFDEQYARDYWADQAA